MSSHREGARLGNALFSLYKGLPPQQQAIFGLAMGLGTPPDVSGFAGLEDLQAEAQEAREHFLEQVNAAGSTKE